MLARMTEHSLLALEHVEAVHHARATLHSLFRDPNRDPRDVARHSHELGDSLKLADIHATLAIAESIDRLVELLKPREVTIELEGTGPAFVDDMSVPFYPAAGS